MKFEHAVFLIGLFIFIVIIFLHNLHFREEKRKRAEMEWNV